MPLQWLLLVRQCASSVWGLLIDWNNVNDVHVISQLSIRERERDRFSCQCSSDDRLTSMAFSRPSKFWVTDSIWSNNRFRSTDLPCEPNMNRRADLVGTGFGSWLIANLNEEKSFHLAPADKRINRRTVSVDRASLSDVCISWSCNPSVRVLREGIWERWLQSRWRRLRQVRQALLLIIADSGLMTQCTDFLA